MVFGDPIGGGSEASNRYLLSNDPKFIEQILAKCCEFRCPSLILSPEIGLYCQAQFAAISQDGVAFDLSPQQQALAFRQFVSCSVGFIHHGQAHFFSSLTRSSSVGDPQGLPRLVLSHPCAIVLTNNPEPLSLAMFPDTWLKIQLFQLRQDLES